ncbi:MAG: hypothetical protein IPK19_36180 [Chloroflexi bacterium]|nr:hypothetical protein [Chloroflexota bacterium]
MHIRTLLFALVVLLFVQPGTAQNAPPATIRVADGCTLADAIRAANTAAAVGACSAGSGGRDLIVLTENVELTARAEGLNGLPVIRSEITLRGGGYVIERSTASGTPPFRLLEIAPEGRLSLENVMLRGGRLTGGNGRRGADGVGIGEKGEFGATGSPGFLVGGMGGEGGNGEAGTPGGVGAAGGSVRGGASYNSGALEMRDCVIDDNVIRGGAGGVAGAGTLGGEGGIGGTGGFPWTLIGILGAGGFGGDGGVGGIGGTGGLGGLAAGGAIFSSGGQVTITRCAFRENQVIGGQGGTGGDGGPGGGGGGGGFGPDFELGPAGMGGRGGSGGTGGAGGIGMGEPLPARTAS